MGVFTHWKMEIKDRGVRIRMNISSPLFFWSGQWIREWNAMSVLSCCTGPRCRATGGCLCYGAFITTTLVSEEGASRSFWKSWHAEFRRFPSLSVCPMKLNIIPLRRSWSAYVFFFFALHRATFLPTSRKEPSCDTWIWTFKRSHDRLNNPQVPFPIGFLDYNMFSLFSFGYPLLKLKQPPSFFMKATFNPSLPHFFKCLQALYVALPD